MKVDFVMCNLGEFFWKEGGFCVDVHIIRICDSNRYYWKMIRIKLQILIKS